MRRSFLFPTVSSLAFLILAGCSTPASKPVVDSSPPASSWKSTSHRISTESVANNTTKTTEPTTGDLPQASPTLVKIEDTPPAPTPAPAASKPATKAPTSAAPATHYTVKKGDTLWKIAHNQHTTVEKLKAANKISNDMIKPGMDLIIPVH